MSWWSQASEAQKLAQIDGGIECGMTGAQIAMASRAEVQQIYHFARLHGRKFPFKAGTAGQRRRGQLVRERAAYLSGEPVDLWHTSTPQDDPFLSMQEGA